MTPLWYQVKLLLGLPVFNLLWLGYSAYAFTVGGLSYWGVDYLVSYYGVSDTTATVSFGAITIVGGIIGTLVGSWLLDKRMRNT